MQSGYTEYGYRGLEEIKRLEEKIVELKKEIEDLKIELKRTKEQWQNSVQT
tara:strand:+ start:247 stop:399 length:153 start_codon:yes stop_codon:yes gene_type:complete